MAIDYSETNPSSPGNESTDPGGLYDSTLPFKTDFLQVDETHSIYYEISGNPNGLPIVFIHGGPGGGTTPSHRRFFDPKGKISFYYLSSQSFDSINILT